MFVVRDGSACDAGQSVFTLQSLAVEIEIDSGGSLTVTSGGESENTVINNNGTEGVDGYGQFASTRLIAATQMKRAIKTTFIAVDR